MKKFQPNYEGSSLIDVTRLFTMHLILILLSSPRSVCSFSLRSSLPRMQPTRTENCFGFSRTTTNVNSSTNNKAEMSSSSSDSLLEEIQSMSVSEIKSELTNLKLSFADIFEKNLLIERLYRAKKMEQALIEEILMEDQKILEEAQKGEQRMIEEIKSMPVQDIVAELMELNISFDDIFEQDLLVQRLYKGRKEEQKKIAEEAEKQSKRVSTKDVIRTPLYFTNLDTNLKVPAVNIAGGGITVNQAVQPYATIQIDVFEDNEDKFVLNLLLDTACSGFVLRPSVTNKYPFLPSLSTPVTMTGAGGSTGTTGLTQLSRFCLTNNNNNNCNDDNDIHDTFFGPLPAAVQEIGALPANLDGIIGLSFLSQFDGIEFDFRDGYLSLYKKGTTTTTSFDDTAASNDLKIVAEGKMSMLRKLGVPYIDVYLDGKGPVKMIVDTGAANTLMNWNGVRQLGLSRTSQEVTTTDSPMGAIGSDNIAMALTHRINVSSCLGIGDNSSDETSGLQIEKTEQPFIVDIGNIPILDSLEGENIGGILGIDAFMRCSVARMKLQGYDNLIIQLFDEK